MSLTFWGLAIPANAQPPKEPLDNLDQIERGKPFWPLDIIGNILSLPKKLILLNSKVDSHKISPETEQTLREFLETHPEKLADVKVRINQWAPAGELKRLAKNKQVEWYFRVFPGIPTTLWSSLTGRILGGDHYNPYTNTIHLFSDDSAIALHEAGHAKDFAEHPSPGYYALGRILAPLELDQEQRASDIAIEHFKKRGDEEGELRAYSTLYPAFGTYGGKHTGLPYGSVVGAGVGHIMGAWQRHERKLGYQALQEARTGDAPVKVDALSQTLIRNREESRSTLLGAFRKN